MEKWKEIKGWGKLYKISNTGFEMDEATIPKITQDEFEEYMRPLSLDLIAAFSLWEDAVYKLIEKSEKEQWPPEVLIEKIEAL